MIAAIYFLCAGTSLVCAVLLWRAYGRNGMRLLLWNALCFSAFAISNLIVVLDKVVFPDIDFSITRLIPSFVGVAVLAYGLVWDNV